MYKGSLQSQSQLEILPLPITLYQYDSLKPAKLISAS